MLNLSLLLILAATGGPAKANSSPPVRTALVVLVKAESTGLTRRYSQVIGINSDGHTDRVFTSQDADRFHVAVVLGPVATTSAFSVVAFLPAQGSQDGFCGPVESPQLPFRTERRMHSGTCKGDAILEVRLVRLPA